jgi:hypothetical protein
MSAATTARDRHHVQGYYSGPRRVRCGDCKRTTEGSRATSRGWVIVTARISLDGRPYDRWRCPACAATVHHDQLTLDLGPTPRATH